MIWDWINKSQGAIMVIVVIALGIWNICLTYKADSRTENSITLNINTQIAKLEERVAHAQNEIVKGNESTQQLVNNINKIITNLAVIEEKLKNATVKSLMVAGATKMQALQFWEKTPLSLVPQSLNKTEPWKKIEKE